MRSLVLGIALVVVIVAARGGGSDYPVKSNPAIVYVAASDSTPEAKAQADYLCDGLDDHAEIQQAVGALPVDGGEVVLFAGLYRLRAGVQLDSNIALSGEGPATILRAEPQVVSALSEDVSQEQDYVVVADAAGSVPGMECMVRDDDSYGVTGVFRRIVAIDGNTVYLDYAIDGLYAGANNALLANVFPLVWAHGEHPATTGVLTNIHVRDLALDGNNAEVGCYGL